MKIIKNNILVSLVIALALVVGGYVIISGGSDSQSDVVETVEEIEETQETFSYDGVAGESALETLKDVATVETDNSSGFGEFVTSINVITATAGENFWAFYVNGEQATVGAGDYVAEEGDQLEWRLETIEL